MRSPRTSSVPTMWNEATIARPRSASSTACARRGRSPRVRALRGSNARARKARWPRTETAVATSRATPSRTRSCSPTARTSPNRKPVRSTAKDCDRDTMMTPSESIPTNNRPMPVSWEILGVRPSAVTPAVITTALATAPTSRLPPNRAANATPGSSPWDIASPRKAMPRSTTQVPASAQMADTRIPPHRARCTKVTSNGAVNQSMPRHYNENHVQQTSPLTLRPPGPDGTRALHRAVRRPIRDGRSSTNSVQPYRHWLRRHSSGRTAAGSRHCSA